MLRETAIAQTGGEESDQSALKPHRAASYWTFFINPCSSEISQLYRKSKLFRNNPGHSKKVAFSERLSLFEKDSNLEKNSVKSKEQSIIEIHVDLERFPLQGIGAKNWISVINDALSVQTPRTQKPQVSQ
jgi:hypothetical protein